MFRELRRKDRSVSKDEAIRIMKESSVGFLGTVGKDGYPYVTPLNFVLVEDKIYFHCAREGHKIDNLKFNPKVCFTAVKNSGVLPKELSTAYESAVAFGRAHVVSSQEETKYALIELTKKYAPDNMEEGLSCIEKDIDKVLTVRIDIEAISGKKR